MKKIFLVMAVLAMLLVAAPASAAAGVNVYVDDNKVSFPDQKPFIDENARTLVPIRFIAEEMGADVGWDGKTELVTIEKEVYLINLTIGEQRAQVNGAWKTFDTNATLKNGRTMVPLRFISETLGAEVEWDDNTRTVYIKTDGNDAAVEPGYEIINGFTVPKDTDMVIDGQNIQVNREIAFRIDVGFPMQAQLNQMKTALESKFGANSIINEVVAYASQKTDRVQTFETKYFYIDGYRIDVGTSAGNYYISILVRKQ